MKHSLKSALAVVTGVTALAGVAAIPAIVSAWGDSDGGRQTYSLQQVNEGALGNKITFNSISIKDTDYDWYKETTGNDLPAGTITEEVNYVGARVDDGKNNGEEYDSLTRLAALPVVKLSGTREESGDGRYDMPSKLLRKS